MHGIVPREFLTLKATIAMIDCPYEQSTVTIGLTALPQA